jgi:hypothetical protein
MEVGPWLAVILLGVALAGLLLISARLPWRARVQSFPQRQRVDNVVLAQPESIDQMLDDATPRESEDPAP